MELKNRTLSNFAELVRTGECKKFRGRLKVGVDLGTANTVLAVVDSTNRPIAGVSAPSHAIRDGVIVNYYESVQLVTKLKEELEEKLGTELLYAAAAIPPGVSVAGHYRIPYEEAEVLKTTPEKEKEIFPVIKATVEKMASITEKFLKGYEIPAVYVVGGSASFQEFTSVFEKKLNLPVYRPVHPLLVTPLGIAYNCQLPQKAR